MFKSLLFFGAGAVLDATGERDMEHLGGLIHRMPQTAFAFLVGCVAISALPPLNGFVSEWLTFQAILLSPQLPQWGLKFLVPGGRRAAGAVGGARRRLLRQGVRRHLSSAGRARPPRRSAHETDRFSLAAMFVLAALCLLAGILPGFFIDALAPVANALVGAQHAACRSAVAWLSIVPIAESRSSYNGLLVFVFIAAVGLARRLRHPSPRLATAARARRPGTAAFPTRARRRNTPPASFAQPIRRVFGTLVFRAREKVDMPPPGDTAPGAAHASSCAIWSGTRSMRRSRGVIGFAADRLNLLQFLTIRRYLSLVFARAGRPAPGARGMALIRDFAVQGAQMLLVLLLAPLLTGFVRKVKARLLRRQGPPLLQPYRDLLRLLRKEVVLADNASWLFRAMPYLIFAAHLGRRRAGADLRAPACCSPGRPT